MLDNNLIELNSCRTNARLDVTLCNLRFSLKVVLSPKTECDAAVRFKLGSCKACKNMLLRLEQIERISSIDLVIFGGHWIRQVTLTQMCFYDKEKPKSYVEHFQCRSNYLV